MSFRFFPEPVFDVVEAPDKLVRCLPQCMFGVEVKESSIIHKGEKDVAELIQDFILGSSADSVVQLANFFFNLLPHFFAIVPIEPHLGGFFLKP